MGRTTLTDRVAELDRSIAVLVDHDSQRMGKLDEIRLALWGDKENPGIIARVKSNTEYLTEIKRYVQIGTGIILTFFIVNLLVLFLEHSELMKLP